VGLGCTALSVADPDITNCGRRDQGSRDRLEPFRSRTTTVRSITCLRLDGHSFSRMTAAFGAAGKRCSGGKGASEASFPTEPPSQLLPASEGAGDFVPFAR
jgi:hypothetical protein